jgi:hypothetical protein
MNNLVIKIDAISQLALKIMQKILARDTEAQKIMDDDSGPLTLASALSIFFRSPLRWNRMRAIWTLMI